MNKNDIYEYSFAGGGYNSYLFATDSKIVYQIKFRDTAYIFDGYLNFDISAFEMIIQVEANPTGKTHRLILKSPQRLPPFLRISLTESQNKSLFIFAILRMLVRLLGKESLINGLKPLKVKNLRK
jgi:hypothetical protein